MTDHNDTSQTPNANEVRDFYDEFLLSRMLSYRLHGNLRIEKATARALDYVKPTSAILDIGCGIGIASEQMALLATEGHVWACDIGGKNVWYASQTIALPNVEFRVIDVLHDIDAVKKWLPRPVNLITLFDVIEHLPLEEHLSLFQNLRGLMAEEASIVLTFPSAGYQRYLQKTNPKELQIVDEIVELPHLLSLADKVGLRLKHFSVEDIWMKNQYTHCVLSTSTEVVDIIPPPVPLLQRAVRRVKNGLDRRFLLPLRRRKYVDHVFRRYL